MACRSLNAVGFRAQEMIQRAERFTESVASGNGGSGPTSVQALSSGVRSLLNPITPSVAPVTPPSTLKRQPSDHLLRTALTPRPAALTFTHESSSDNSKSTSPVLNVRKGWVGEPSDATSPRVARAQSPGAQVASTDHHQVRRSVCARDGRLEDPVHCAVPSYI
jgi:hypothetical protein